ncbi:15502_t:CDS:2 [Gigaspora margarita]|uniref:15502_t:CDS:1 n=1 Tax=Gigaspora margarita TaxID=4874 RepID=A0ABM8W4D4_GIGMA|nr:15502_t:CDS:2 [Gigaspora margarita]
MFQVNTIFENEPLEYNEQLVNLTSNLTSPNNNILQPVNQNNPLPNIPKFDLVPLTKRKHLSLIFLHYFLGHIPSANSFSEYKTLAGTMNYSQNLHLTK